ncbi:hypothetical protein N431DRAFT_450746 [Stipitochalara longipes BDJ]|nr:hypothetical protein N431DRAFT_450746 [Stipitochalara longipes BDJ]
MSQTAVQQAAAALVANATTDVEFRRAEIHAKIEAIIKESDAKVQFMQEESTSRIAAMNAESTARIAKINEIAQEEKKNETYKGQDERRNIRERWNAERDLLDEESNNRMESENRVTRARVDMMWKRMDETEGAEVGGERRLGKRRR